MSKTILTCAITGSLTRPDMTPYLPITPAQIAESALRAADAGAAVVHLHVRNPENGTPSMELDHYTEVLHLIKARNRELVINLTTGVGARFIGTHIVTAGIDLGGDMEKRFSRQHGRSRVVVYRS
jgi:uncharacterized protein (DUF849 family)